MLVVHIVHVCSGSCLQVSRWRRRQAKNRCVVHVCSFFKATSHDQLGDPCGGYTCPCYPSEKTTYDVNKSALEWR